MIYMKSAAAIELPDLVTDVIEEVEIFHRKLIENRQYLLSAEIHRLEVLIQSILFEKKLKSAVFIRSATDAWCPRRVYKAPRTSGNCC